ncbi:MAG: ATP-binding protein, partial [Limisphaerales bacterium]
HYAVTQPEVVPGPYLRIEVRDTGVGIPEALQSRIFEAFFSTKPEGHGTGLGLTTARGIVRDHKGFVTFTSTLHKGTTFILHLPATTDFPRGTEPSAAADAPPRGCGELILVVDDERAICETTRRHLERYGYSVLCAYDGIDALAKFSSNSGEVRAMVTDFLMPLMDGVMLCRAIRAIAPQLPIVVSSGGLAAPLGSQACQSFEELGIRHILHKPHTADLLLHAIAKELQGAKAPGDSK